MTQFANDFEITQGQADNLNARIAQEQNTMNTQAGMQPDNNEHEPWDWQELCCPHGNVSGETCPHCGTVPEPETMHDPANIAAWDNATRHAERSNPTT